MGYGAGMAHRIEKSESSAADPGHIYFFNWTLDYYPTFNLGTTKIYTVGNFMNL
jgi:hypothetical protein